MIEVRKGTEIAEPLRLVRYMKKAQIEGCLCQSEVTHLQDFSIERPGRLMFECSSNVGSEPQDIPTVEASNLHSYEISVEKAPQPGELVRSQLLDAGVAPPSTHTHEAGQ